jgi:hypothetical protein
MTSFHVALATSLCIALAAHAHGEAPKGLTAFGATLGQSPDAVRAVLTKRYPTCAILPSVYHESPGFPPDVTAIFDIARGTLDVCRDTPDGKDLEDALSVTFAHPSIAEGQPAYQIYAERVFPDVALAPRGKIVHSFNKVRDELFRLYGKPTEQDMQPIASAAADLEKSIAVGSNVKREDFRVRYLWASRGHLEANLETPTCDCGPRYVQADLEISRSPSTSPKNQYYVLSLHLLVRNAELGTKQDAWNAQWQSKGKTQ